MAPRAKSNSPTIGRPKGESAVSHDAILAAVHDLLKSRSVRDLTIEQVCVAAGVSKPTIYKWWPTKVALVMDMFEERLTGQLPGVDGATPEQAIRQSVPEVVRLLGGLLGKVAADIIAEGQGDPAVLKEFRDRFILKRRVVTVAFFRRAAQAGTIDRDLDPEVLVDLIFGPIYYRLLVGHLQLDRAFADELVRQVLASLAGGHRR